MQQQAEAHPNLLQAPEAADRFDQLNSMASHQSVQSRSLPLPPADKPVVVDDTRPQKPA
ncbi:MAG: hypothetical protein ACLVJH_14130 [Faecalibacterium prausnitzii]